MNPAVRSALLAPGDPGPPTGAATTPSEPAPSAPSSVAPTSTGPAPAGGSGLVPAVKPDMNSTGMAAFTDLTNTVAGWTLLGCLLGFLISGFVFVIGPAIGFSRARQFAGLGMIGALAIAAVVGLAAGLVNLFYTMFSSA